MTDIFGREATNTNLPCRTDFSVRAAGRKKTERSRVASLWGIQETYRKQNMDCSAWMIRSRMDSSPFWAMAIPLAQENPSRERYSRQIS